MARKTTPHKWANHPELLTSIKSPWDKFRKADWNFEKYENAIFARPCDSEAVVYTALDFCVAIVSLRDWTRKTLVSDVRKVGKSLPTGLISLDNFREFVIQRVPWQQAVEAIANTVKHAEYRDTGWPQGIAMPTPFFPDNLKADQDACSDGIELFTLIRKHKDVVWWDIALRQHPSKDTTSGYEAFGNVLQDWQRLLTEVGYMEV